jgi:hypothetical protein
MLRCARQRLANDYFPRDRGDVDIRSSTQGTVRLMPNLHSLRDTPTRLIAYFLSSQCPSQNTVARAQANATRHSCHPHLSSAGRRHSLGGRGRFLSPNTLAFSAFIFSFALARVSAVSSFRRNAYCVMLVGSTMYLMMHGEGARVRRCEGEGEGEGAKVRECEGVKVRKGEA